MAGVLDPVTSAVIHRGDTDTGEKVLGGQREEGSNVTSSQPHGEHRSS